ncbi:GPI mannosyltransferase 1-like [Patiria miniata]|uniref:GPI alpha-1,4-mannosyltransferase I, catalytic subunit n=1 Tax=Patiria miniata TaxID=46514 RepID=A0A914B3W5_PATMI|nr:GPI mannosyltransferase 1-like [Patiria miniata]XP_038070187.1 GPI mannosyltransferase 1-like [Patiria miniata]XP_038070190.1 GPI mannosyltransferase 1-like [Patiria miniata]XP_038070191.1 GPI mannosyltransferase 1-like [Patiria miniata]XP_038070192.1 GPI mannosyltransferase 1-like [Patiria miniata]XP_038070193.1 GPI mannosyltransferase 1-like [Patiria miniata]XP_038070194.1 GPI mannosyltransferase 1-like [Patiria miniata]XP_038070195.1 GPI mannosyltransferase 1-like [Patiria miniata]
MAVKFSRVTLAWCGAAFLLRLVLVVYGEWQDRTMLVKYTDVDYHVFTDAARYVSQGSSPYERATYRYTPLLAWALTPNILLTPVFGKIIFILCDVLTGTLILKMLKLSGCPDQAAINSALLWWLNPLPMTVSSRGNAESIMSVLVLSTLYALMKRHTRAAAFLYAVSVHVKIYPVTYCVPIYFLLGSDFCEKPLLKRSALHLKDRILRRIAELFWPCKSRLEFVFVSVATFALLTGLMYYCYGDKFLEETYLYHVTRRDVRHNFSPYFYMLYLTSESPVSVMVGLLAFLPQALLMVALSVRYYRDLAFCCFTQTFLFVAFNKVCTSQYFLWYLCLLPLVIPTLRMKLSEALCLTGLWFLGQALWLYFAYCLEFEGHDTFLFLWLAGLAFFAVNIGILVRIMMSYEEHRTFCGGKLAPIGQDKR